MRRPNRRVGDIVRTLLACPLCRRGPPRGESVRVVAYGRRSIRVACRACGLRFTIDRINLATAIDTEPIAGAYEHVVGDDDQRRNAARDTDRLRKADERASARWPHTSDAGGHGIGATPPLHAQPQDQPPERAATPGPGRRPPTARC
jgi:hypothetical protein